MCICGGIGEAVVVTAIGGYVMKKKLRLTLPPLVELVGKVRRGVRPGQVFKDKRKAAKVNERASVRKECGE